jgi:hypothetical protein
MTSINQNPIPPRNRHVVDQLADVLRPQNCPTIPMAADAGRHHRVASRAAAFHSPTPLRPRRRAAPVKNKTKIAADEIRRLESRETKLRAALLLDDADRVGQDYEAIIFEQDRERFDVKAAVQHFGADVLRRFFRRTTYKTVRLKQRHSAMAAHQVERRRL